MGFLSIVHFEFILIFLSFYRVATFSARQFKGLVVTEKMFDMYCVLGRKAAGSWWCYHTATYREFLTHMENINVFYCHCEHHCKRNCCTKDLWPDTVLYFCILFQRHLCTFKISWLGKGLSSFLLIFMPFWWSVVAFYRPQYNPSHPKWMCLI